MTEAKEKICDAPRIHQSTTDSKLSVEYLGDRYAKLQEKDCDSSFDYSFSNRILTT